MLKWIGVVGIKMIVLDNYFFPSPLPSFFYPFEESLNTLKNEAEFIIFLNNGDFSIPEIRKNKSQESFNCKHFHNNKKPGVKPFFHSLWCDPVGPPAKA